MTFNRIVCMHVNECVCVCVIITWISSFGCRMGIGLGCCCDEELHNVSDKWISTVVWWMAHDFYAIFVFSSFPLKNLLVWIEMSWSLLFSVVQKCKKKSPKCFNNLVRKKNKIVYTTALCRFKCSMVNNQSLLIYPNVKSLFEFNIQISFDLDIYFRRIYRTVKHL